MLDEHLLNGFTMSTPHTSVLMSEVLHIFEEQRLRIFVDGTLGAGGHAQAILEAHPELEMLIGFDQDPEALQIARNRLEPWSKKVHFIPRNFSDMPQVLHSLKIPKVDGILLDLGVSSMQLDQAERGFSFMREGPLDMRMNPEQKLTAAEVVNEWSQDELGRIFREYGEEKQWRAAARAIVTARNMQPIRTTQELVAVLRPMFSWKKTGINPLTLVFQALRICVNHELEVLENILPKAIDLLVTGGRFAVISFHSLEDRLVKEAFRFAASDKQHTSGLAGLFLNKDPIVKILTKKPISATEDEVERNPRSRSAKLRAVEKL